MSRKKNRNAKAQQQIAAQQKSQQQRLSQTGKITQVRRRKISGDELELFERFQERMPFIDEAVSDMQAAWHNLMGQLVDDHSVPPEIEEISDHVQRIVDLFKDTKQGYAPKTSAKKKRKVYCEVKSKSDKSCDVVVEDKKPQLAEITFTDITTDSPFGMRSADDPLWFLETGIMMKDIKSTENVVIKTTEDKIKQNEDKIKQKIMEIISSEDCRMPISDEEILTKLIKSGMTFCHGMNFHTVWKYRQEMKIPDSIHRKHKQFHLPGNAIK